MRKWLHYWLWQLQGWWWSLRHKRYYYSDTVRPSGGDDTANIQAAINLANGEEPYQFKEIMAAYQRKWYRFFIRKPVLQRVVRLTAGTFSVSGLGGIEFRGPAVIQGAGRYKTTIQRKP